ncbi:hypothetical protein AHOG_20850 [Actinoalloteichus hoggarensis]|uniref:NADP-dependent oxidoreductase domain-containing protein n=1 Tax=Actinoalloteichus hoggarensis TaxID=1470176 RepID=A0A221W8W3_9PSEU|nr:hypothetical protein AHOG_20850 [Actinoalloteichus hoggarensis]
MTGDAAVPTFDSDGLGGLRRFPLALGGAAFGRGATEAESFALLDAFVGAVGTMLDTRSHYGAAVGGSDSIIGRRLHARGRRADVVLTAKVGDLPGGGAASAAPLRASVEAELGGCAPITWTCSASKTSGTPCIRRIRSTPRAGRTSRTGVSRWRNCWARTTDSSVQARRAGSRSPSWRPTGRPRR